jgi:hypothetical protein
VERAVVALDLSLRELRGEAGEVMNSSQGLACNRALELDEDCAFRG